MLVELLALVEADNDQVMKFGSLVSPARDLGKEAGLTDGVGWAQVGTVSVPYVRLASEERFEDYPDGTIPGEDLKEGTGWDGSAVVFNW